MNEMLRKFRSTGDLVDAGLVPAAAHGDIARVEVRYAIALTPAVAGLIDRGTPDDPIARQFIPDVRELQTHPAELADPIGDHPHSPAPGIVHRYKDRVLFKIASVCPVYCRFCFRREMVGPQLGEALSPEQIETALAYIRAHREVEEVILTGGDPLILSPRRVAEITKALSQIPHVQILRWHTRVPVVDPSRITPELIEALTDTAKVVVVAIHTNHVRELTDDAREAVARLAGSGIPLLSQTVLLKGVNDSAGTLEDLMRALVENRIKPYYLHHGDLAPGTSHFRTTIAEGQAIMLKLRSRLPAPALPSYVLDIPGGYGKVAIETHVMQNAGGTYTVRDPAGNLHAYADAVVS